MAMAYGLYGHGRQTKLLYSGPLFIAIRRSTSQNDVAHTALPLCWELPAHLVSYLVECKLIKVTGIDKCLCGRRRPSPARKPEERLQRKWSIREWWSMKAQRRALSASGHCGLAVPSESDATSRQRRRPPQGSDRRGSRLPCPGSSHALVHFRHY